MGGLLHRGEPVARLEELEMLALGIEGKLALWLALRHGTGNSVNLTQELLPELDRLVERPDPSAKSSRPCG